VAVNQYSADAVRLALADAGDGIEDANFEPRTGNAAILRLTKELAWIEVWWAFLPPRTLPISTPMMPRCILTRQRLAWGSAGGLAFSARPSRLLTTITFTEGDLSIPRSRLPSPRLHAGDTFALILPRLAYRVWLTVTHRTS